MNYRIVVFSFSMILVLSACGSGGPTSFGKPTGGDPAAPVLDSIGDKVVVAGNNLTFTISATDPNSSTLIYSTDGTVGVGDPYNVTSTNNATFDAANAQFNWTPTIDDIGIYTVEFTVTNALDKSASETITISVVQSTAVGQSLFESQCTGSGCHTVSDFSNITVTEPLISTAIDNDTGGMGSLSVLTITQRQTIADYLQSLK